MDKNKLVSIITPCYNGGHCLSRLMDSVIAQTYRPIEFILVNDGSTDNTRELAESYKLRFEETGILFLIVNQENKGLAGAINAGLKVFTGDYLCWPDADDYLEPTSVEDRVNALEEHSEVAVTSSDAYLRDIDNLNVVKGRLSEVQKSLYKNDPNQFMHLLDSNAIFCSGCHMVRTSMFLDVHPDREIFPARRGQNWQLLLPLYYKYKWYYLDKPLYNYVSYPNSMSKGDDSFEKRILRAEEHEEIITESLKKIEKIQKADMSGYYSYIRNRYSRTKLTIAYQFRNRTAFMDYYKEKKNSVGLNRKDRLLYLLIKCPLLDSIAKALHRLKK